MLDARVDDTPVYDAKAGFLVPLIVAPGPDGRVLLDPERAAGLAAELLFAAAGVYPPILQAADAAVRR